MSTPMMAAREALGELPNPLGLQGVEFIEYATSRPQALGQALERMGFQPVARHRSREVLLYRQGDMNIIVNAHQDAERTGLHAPPALTEAPVLAAVAFRVGNAAAAFRRVLELGAWAVHTEVEVMELNIPAIHGVGASRIYFVDRWKEFSIYDVDFVPIPTVTPRPPALQGLHCLAWCSTSAWGARRTGSTSTASCSALPSWRPTSRLACSPMAASCPARAAHCTGN